MKNKKCLLVLMMLFGVMTMSVPVSAATPDVVPKELQMQNEEKPTEKMEDKKSGPITPDGNLTLVYDFSGKQTEAKQFITLVTKDRNYFYLIIDRDDEGKETVHFLNQVDEADLFALMEDEEIEALENESEEPVEEIILEEPETIVVEEQEETKPEVSMGAVLSGVAVAVGLLIMAGVKVKGIIKEDKKEAKKVEEEEEEYYDFLDLEQEMNGEGLDEESI